jgi:uncharacterized membrane protein
MGRVKQHWTNIRSSLWFIPTLIVVGAIVLALGVIETDQQMDQMLRERWPRLFATEADGARAMLAAIAGSMITVAGVVFSITIVALALASSQYTPRILRNFMRDKANQTVLGVFVGIFTYCLIVLRTISGGSNGAFVPALAVLVAVILVLAGIGFLIFFIHHIASSIQASEITTSISKETIEAIERLFPQELGRDGDEQEDRSFQPQLDQSWQTIPSPKMGYIQHIETDAVLRFARRHNTIVRMEQGIGQFVAEGMPLVSVSIESQPDAAMRSELTRLYAIGSYRTVAQDPAFGIRQLVDIALKALSPGVNDTTTAVNCLDHLSAILVRLAPRRISSDYRFDERDLRVIAIGPTFESLVRLAFEQILENGAGNLAIILALLSAIERIGMRTTSEQRRSVLLRQVALIEEVAEQSLKLRYACQEAETHSARLRATLMHHEHRHLERVSTLVDAG